MCFDNISKKKDNRIHDLYTECMNKSIDVKQFTKVGLGLQADSTGNVYGVRIFSTRQKSA